MPQNIKMMNGLNNRIGRTEKVNKISLSEELKNNAYPGRGIVIGRSADGTKAVAAYFIMGRK